MGFWWGFVIGLFIGANVGIVVVGALTAAKRSEPEPLMLEVP